MSSLVVKSLQETVFSLSVTERADLNRESLSEDEKRSQQHNKSTHIHIPQTSCPWRVLFFSPVDHRESTHTYTDLPPHTSSARSSAFSESPQQRFIASLQRHGHKSKGLAAQGWSVKESRLWSPDRSCLWYSGLCLYGVETGAGTSSCRGVWCPPPAAWDGPRQATGARVSSWGPAEGAGSSRFSDRTSSAGCWSWAWSHRWEESVNRRDEIFICIVEWMLGSTCNVFLTSTNSFPPPRPPSQSLFCICVPWFLWPEHRPSRSPSSWTDP